MPRLKLNSGKMAHRENQILSLLHKVVYQSLYRKKWKVPLTDDGIYHSTVLPSFWLKLAWLWQTPLPNSELIFADIITAVEGVLAEVASVYQLIKRWLLSK